MVNVKSYTKLAVDTLARNKKICFPLISEDDFAKIVEGVRQTVPNIEVDNQKHCIRLVDTPTVQTVQTTSTGNVGVPPVAQNTSIGSVGVSSTNVQITAVTAPSLASKRGNVRVTIRISEDIAKKMQEVYKTDSVSMAVRLAITEALKQHGIEIQSTPQTKQAKKYTIPDIDEIFK